MVLSIEQTLLCQEMIWRHPRCGLVIWNVFDSASGGIFFTDPDDHISSTSTFALPVSDV